MTSAALLPATPDQPRKSTWLRWVTRGFRREWRIVLFGAATLAAALSPSLYDRQVRQATAQAVCAACWQSLPGYALLSILAGAVLTHIVAVTAATYGLSHLALEAVVRVFVVELIPLAAALFVAMRSGLDVLSRLAELRAQGLDFGVARRFERQLVPGVVANAFAVVLLTLTSGVLVLAVAYLMVYGLTPWGLTGYTRLVGQVFDPVTAPGLLLKILLFGIAVAIAPVTVVLDSPRRAAQGSEMRIMARLFLLLVLIEGAALLLLHF
ncbi:MAG: ABC transporter permease [Rhodocyclaceae bacterium]|nr:ABC transporter permease [Rhodocyclaceae bacterium]